MKIEEVMTYFHALSPKVYFFADEHKFTAKAKSMNFKKMTPKMSDTDIL